MIVHDIGDLLSVLSTAIIASGKGVKDLSVETGVSAPTLSHIRGGAVNGVQGDTAIRILNNTGWVIEIRRRKRWDRE